MSKSHDFTASIRWTGDRGEGNRRYLGYARTWNVETASKAPIACSNDPLLGGDASKPNPEDLLLASLAACHMLWYLHLASKAGIVVRSYRDDPIGEGETGSRGEGRFVRAVLRPTIVLDPGSDTAAADALHHEVADYCFIARSINFPVSYQATYAEGESDS